MINQHDIEAFERFDNGPINHPNKGSSLDDFLKDLMDDYAPDYYGKVIEFRKAFGRPTDLNFKKPNLDDFWFCHKLINEEFKELSLAFTNSDRYLVENSEITVSVRENMLKEMCDLLYVVFDMAATFNLPIGEAFNRVHRSNMSKLGADGKPVYRDDGKVLKGPNYKEPNLKDLV